MGVATHKCMPTERGMFCCVVELDGMEMPEGPRQSQVSVTPGEGDGGAGNCVRNGVRRSERSSPKIANCETEATVVVTTVISAAILNGSSGHEFSATGEGSVLANVGRDGGKLRCDCWILTGNSD